MGKRLITFFEFDVTAIHFFLMCGFLERREKLVGHIVHARLPTAGVRGYLHRPIAEARKRYNIYLRWWTACCYCFFVTTIDISENSHENVYSEEEMF